MNTGRIRVYTDEPKITQSNIIDVLRKAFTEYQPTFKDIEKLIKYEKGEQPITRKKVYRKDIDFHCVDNLANEITEFKTGFIWGNPITFIQRGKEENADKKVLDAVAKLNSMYDAVDVKAKTQHLARNVEITGIGFTYADVDLRNADDGKYFQYESIDPDSAFIIYSSYYLDKRKMVGVTFRKDKQGILHFTCFTETQRFEISNWEHTSRSGESNPLGIIPLVEWNRDFDRMGCFERQMSEMNNLNLLISDFTNDVEQNTQAIWHANDVEFPTETIANDDGSTSERVVKPRAGEWVNTFTPADGKTPFINALSIDYDYHGMLENILTRRALILQKCNVPQRNDNSGGSTGIATNTATGYEAAETNAAKQQNIMECCKMEELKVVLRAIKKHPDIKGDSPLANLKITDVMPNVKRQKTYELSIKVNSISTLLSHGFALEDVVTIAPLFSDPNEVVNRSGEGVRRYQEATVFKTGNETSEKRPFPDTSDQEGNSPFLGK